MHKLTYMPLHYKTVVKPFDEVGKSLDTDFRVGWRPLMITAHPNGVELIVLLEKMPDK